MCWGRTPTASERTVAISSSPPSTASVERALRSPRSTARTAMRASGRSVRPAGVSATPRGSRLKTGPASSASSARMCWDSVGWLMPTRRAARVNEPSSTTATKHSSARMFIVRTYRIDGLYGYLTYRTKGKKLDPMRVTGINHVSIAARDLDESTRFYVEVFGMEPIATPVFATRVQWLRCGDLQLHLFLDEDGEAPARHHLGLTVDDFDAAYDA